MEIIYPSRYLAHLQDPCTIILFSFVYNQILERIKFNELSVHTSKNNSILFLFIRNPFVIF